MIKKLAVRLLAASVLVFCAHASAEINVGAYREFQKDPVVKDKVADYVIGVGRGVFWANVMLRYRGQEQLFCMPEKLALDGPLIESLLDQEIRTPASGVPYQDDASIELIVLRALESRFPCPGKNQE
jgi:hypothetical protein